MIRVFLIEDHETIIVSGLRQLFRPQRDQIAIMGCAKSVKEAFRKKEISRADVIILDLWIPNEKPTENVKRIKEKLPKIPVIIMTTEDSPEWIRKMMIEGVKGYIVKTAKRKDLKMAIQKVAAGGIWFTSSLTQADQEKIAIRTVGSISPLTPLQRQIMEFLINGKKIKEVAEILKVKPANIEKVLICLRERYVADTTVELIKILIDKGLL